MQLSAYIEPSLPSNAQSYFHSPLLIVIILDIIINFRCIFSYFHFRWIVSGLVIPFNSCNSVPKHPLGKGFLRFSLRLTDYLRSHVFEKSSYDITQAEWHPNVKGLNWVLQSIVFALQKPSFRPFQLHSKTMLTNLYIGNFGYTTIGGSLPWDARINGNNGEKDPGRRNLKFDPKTADRTRD